jgi:REP element-mobilizing transposase RayT
MRQVEMKFRTWGGKRKGAGRPQVNARKSEPHRVRTPINWNKPVHVSLRVVKDVGRLRRLDRYAVIRKCLVLLLDRTDFRVIHVSIQSNHIHLIIEAASATALARGLQAFQISAARRLNAELGRRGTVFPDRYHATVITSRRGARNALAYVLNNWRRHREDLMRDVEDWLVDEFSSGVYFDGWKERFNLNLADDYEPLPVVHPESWLLRIGWKKYGAISIHELPGRA